MTRLSLPLILWIVIAHTAAAEPVDAPVPSMPVRERVVDCIEVETYYGQECVTHWDIVPGVVEHRAGLAPVAVKRGRQWLSPYYRSASAVTYDGEWFKDVYVKGGVLHVVRSKVLLHVEP